MDGAMFDWDAVVLARAQFAFTMSFHIVFPAFSIGLASYLAVLEALWLWTGREVFINLFNYWLKIFAVAFGMGVVSGIVMSYQFGTNWSTFADKTGPIIGPLMGYEVLTAFFLEAGFLGVMLFGLERVGHRLHFLATLMVAIGTLISAFWILSANSWMQTPTGDAVNADGQFVAADWLKVIFNPSFPYRLVHMVLAAYLTTALVVGAVGAFHLLRDSHLAGARVMFSMAMWMAALVAPIQIVAGDQHGLNTLEHQTTEVMALEGHSQSHPDGAPLVLLGLPDRAEGKVKYAIELPKLGSLILKHSLDAPLAGLDTVPRENWPPVPITFWSFRIMVGMGFLMVALGLFSLWTRWRGTLYETRPLHIFALAMGPAGFIAVLVYVVMDGFDLGLGLLFPLFQNKTDRDVIMNSVAPVWDGNETWLVLGGGGLMAAFPLAYAVLMPALYTPIIAMLVGLIFRGVAFEFRWRTESEENRWDIAFAGGSWLATLAQGIALGAILQGVHVESRHYAGGWWDWLTPFSILTGLALAVGYALLGATWLVLKTEGELREKAYRLSWYLLFAMLGAIGMVSLATPFLHIHYAARWFTWPNVILTAPVPLAVGGLAALLLR